MLSSLREARQRLEFYRGKGHAWHYGPGQGLLKITGLGPLSGGLRPDGHDNN